MHSKELPGIMQRWHTPPRKHNQGIKTEGARKGGFRGFCGSCQTGNIRRNTGDNTLSDAPK